MKKSLIAILLLLSAASCAEQKEFDATEFDKGAFARWMEKYHPEATPLSDGEAGIYVEWLAENPDGVQLREGYWFETNYSVRDQNGDLVYTRSPQNAHLLFGSAFDPAIRYIPEQIRYLPTSMSYTFAIGQTRFLPRMAEGDSVRLYLAPKWGYYPSGGFSYSAENHFGYAKTNASVTSSMGLIVDMRLNRVIKDIDLYEREQVTRWAAERLGITDPADSIALGVYMKKTVENPEGDSVKTDSKVMLYYTGRFLDGHLLDTNVDSVAQAHNILLTDEKKGPAEMTPHAGLIDAFSEALLEMQAGERVRFVTTSDGAYGSEGSRDEKDNHLTVPPYTPLEFEIYVESVENSEEEEEEEE